MWEQQQFAFSEFFQIVDAALQPYQYGCSVEPLRELININPTFTPNPLDLLSVFGWIGDQEQRVDNIDLCDCREIGSPSSSSDGEHQSDNFDLDLYPTIDDSGIDVFGVYSGKYALYIM